MLSDKQIQQTFEILEIPPERISEGSPICIPCPFEHRHTKQTRPSDCQLYFNDGPNLFCFHESCKDELEEFCRLLRFEVTGSCRGDFDPSFFGPRPDERFAREVKESRSKLIHKYTGILTPAPVKISSIELLIRLFELDDVLWIGQEYHSGNEKFKAHFQPLSDWIKKPPPPNWDFTCGATFWPGSFSRCNEAVAQRRYLPLESDLHIPREEQWAMFAWAIHVLSLTLIQITWSGNKSDHAWVKWPGESWFRQYQPALEAMGFDVSTMRKSQPIRLGGATNVKTGNLQEILWLQK
jgi:hypothetical protein